MLTKEKLLEQDYQNTINELVESADLLLKGNRMLVENQLSKKEYQVLEEGLWEKVKYNLGKLGRYKAGGKILGKGKIDQEAGAKIQAIIDKKGNEVIKKLNDQIKSENPEFPNNEKGEQFLKTVMEIAAIYDSIVEATKKGPKEEGYLPIDAANTMIEDLAQYVQKFLDVDLSAAYSVMDSEEDKVGEDGELLIDSVDDINEDEAADTRAKLQAKKGDGKDRDSLRTQGLKSNKLPLILAGVGASLGALGWMAQTDWLKSLIESWLNKPGTQGSDAVYKTITGGKGGDPQGFLHWANQIDPSNPMKTGADVTKFVDKFGAENVSHMFDGNGAGDSMDQVGKLQQLVGGDNAGKSVGELFKGDTFGDMKGGRNLFGVSKAASFVAKVLVKEAVKAVAGSTAGTVLAAKIAAVGTVLVPIGIGLVATGALVKLMRMKGLKQSRAKTLQDLLNSIQPIKAEDVPNNPPVLPEKPKDETGEGESTSGPKDKTQVYKDLTKFFQFIVNNKKQLNIKTTLSGDALVSKKDRENPKNESIIKNEMVITEGKFIKDKRTLEYLTKKSSLDKVKKFEEFLTRLEYIRNVVKKMGNTEDKVINDFVKKLKTNPIMATDFVKMFNVPSDNPKGVQSLKGFIDEIFNNLYSGKNKKMANIVDKMATLGGGNINKMEESRIYEDKGYNVDQPNKSFVKDAQDRTAFKKHLNNFIMGLMGMFQYMHKLKKEGKLGSNKPNQGQPTKPNQGQSATSGNQQESVNKMNPLLIEEIGKMKLLMNKLIK